jgi:hypothetical protein
MMLRRSLQRLFRRQIGLAPNGLRKQRKLPRRKPIYNDTPTLLEVWKMNTNQAKNEVE